jgi:Zn-finger nucleic acid-binding protein
MQCPVCENVSLTMSERQGVEIDYCPKCGACGWTGVKSIR